MLKQAALFLFTALCSLADTTTVKLGTHGTFAIDVPPEWRFSCVESPLGGCIINITANDESKSEVKLVLFYCPKPTPIDAAKLRGVLQNSSAQFVKGSVEGKPNIKSYGFAKGYGEYCIFTDSALVGKKTKEGGFKYVAPGLIQLTDEVILGTTIFGNDPQDRTSAAILMTIETIKITPTK